MNRRVAVLGFQVRRPGSVMRIHHIGYLVRKIDKAIVKFKELGYSVEKEPVYDEYRQSDIAFLTKDGYRIELVSPEKTSEVYPLLKKFGASPYHICYETDDIDKDTAGLKDQGYMIFTEKQPAPAIGEEAEVVFLFHSQAGMIELVEI